MGNLSNAMLKGAKAYQGQKVADRNSLVVKYAPLVKRVALHLKTRLPSYVDVNDLIQSGMIGLMDAIQNYKDGHGATFETYAAIRIRGSIIDELRQSDWTPRSVHQNTRAIRETLARLSHTYGRPPTDAEMAAELKVDINKYHQMILDSNTSQVMCIEDTGLTDDVIGERPFSDINALGPDDKLFESVNGEQFKHALATSIQKLPERERTIIGLYYDQEMNLREIGLIMGISESRTCQVLSQAVVRLRNALDEWAYVPKKEQVLANNSYRQVAQEVTKKAQTHLTKRKSSLFDDNGEVADNYFGSTANAIESSVKVSNAYSNTANINADNKTIAENEIIPDQAPALEAKPIKAPARRGRPSLKSKANSVNSVNSANSNGSCDKEPMVQDKSEKSERKSARSKVKAEGASRTRGRPSAKPVVMSMEEFEAMQKAQAIIASNS